jgi:hypothetical protein
LFLEIVIYRTSHEISYLRDLRKRDNAKFLSAAAFILLGRRLYAGEGMHVNVVRLRAFLEKTLTQDGVDIQELLEKESSRIK